MKLVDILKEEWEKRQPQIEAVVPGAIFEFWVMGAIYIAEIVRMEHVHPTYHNSDFRRATPRLMRKQHPKLFSVLEHLGDFYDGYYIPYCIYTGLSFVFPKISERYRLGISLIIIANEIIAAKEMGLVDGQKHDYLDIPAGIAGTLFYVGMHYLGKAWVKRFLKDNKGLREENKSESSGTSL